jgi:hypothetical protein
MDSGPPKEVHMVFDHDETMYSGPPKKEAATYLAATDMPVYNLIDPDTLHVTTRTDLLLNFGTTSSLLLKERKI